MAYKTPIGAASKLRGVPPRPQNLTTPCLVRTHLPREHYATAVTPWTLPGRHAMRREYPAPLVFIFASLWTRLPFGTQTETHRLVTGRIDLGQGLMGSALFCFSALCSENASYVFRSALRTVSLYVQRRPKSKLCRCEIVCPSRPQDRRSYSIARKQPMEAGPAGQDDTGPRAVDGRMGGCVICG
jgi:hypothetical protein